MFTGLVEKIGTVRNIEKTSLGAKIEIEASFDNLKIGDSVMVNGACQTVVEVGSTFKIDVMNETLKLTNLALLKKGDIVNLERALSVNGRFDGHIVTGHIDNMAQLSNIRKDGISQVLRFSYDTKYLVKKGSISINGVSLTLSCVENDFFEVSLIPHTIENTNLKNLKIGDFVNIEVDILAKYIEKFCSKNNDNEKKEQLSEEFLRKCGF